MSEQRHVGQEPDPMDRMIVMLKDLQQEVRLLKEGKTQEIKTMLPLWATKTELNQKEGQ